MLSDGWWDCEMGTCFLVGAVGFAEFLDDRDLGNEGIEVYRFMVW
jgi:hypothetical protein